MNAPVQDRDDPVRVREEIAQIVGCRMVDGVCVKHQSRPWELSRSGCPYVDSLMRAPRGTQATMTDPGGPRATRLDASASVPEVGG